MIFIAQSGGEPTRPTFYQIDLVGEAIFYYLAVVAKSSSTGTSTRA